MNKILDKIQGTLYGMAIGDAMGMPSELWGRQRVRKHFGIIKDFLPGPPENEVAKNYKRGEFTDDTAQALVIVDSLIRTKFIPNSKDIGLNLLEWAKKEDAWNKNILGPTSKATLEAIKNNKDPKPFSKKALSNGSAMRIGPIGTLFKPGQEKDLANYVKQITSITHSSDVGIAGAAIIATGVSYGIHDVPFDQFLKNIYELEVYFRSLGEETFSPLFKKRIELGVKIAKKYKDQDQKFIEELYDVVGAGVSIIESVPAAISLAYYSSSVKKCALLSANMAGDTDTIGAMACAILGAYIGFDQIDKSLIKTIDDSNEVKIHNYANALLKGTKITWKI